MRNAPCRSSRTMALRALIAACTLATASCADQSAQGPAPREPAGEPPTAMLSDVVRPSHYAVELEIFPDRDGFSGSVGIDVEFDAEVTGFWMHGKDLSIRAARLVAPDGSETTIDWEQVTQHGVSRVELADAFGPGPGRLEFEYDAPFSEGLVGLYRVGLGDDSYAFTQLENIYARRVFPSFDEPRFKTTWDVAVTTDAALEAISNMPVVAETRAGEGLKRVEYERTPLLPTYLIAFAIGPLDIVEWVDVPPNDVRQRPLPLRGIAVRGQGPRLEYALSQTAPILEAIESYFDLPYPFPKLDFVAVPEFGAGGMENAGLITYRESEILFDGTPSIANQRGYGAIHAHEIAHMWFGDYVTMVWWDDIWLNEAFASWMESVAGQAWKPEYYFDRMPQLDGLSAMYNDELASARRIREAVNDEADIENAFDAITYQKGSGVLGMMENWLGPEVFRTGLRHYMREHAWSNATVYELMASLTKAAGEDVPVQPVFDSFLRQPGVPMLKTRLDCDSAAPVLRVEQSRYLPAGSNAATEAGWNVPVCVAWGDALGRQSECFVLEQPSQSFELPAQSCPAWVVPNAGGHGYYRWSLPEDQFASLMGVFDEALTVGERVSVADSLTASVRSGDTELTAFLETLPTILGATERLVALQANDLIERIVLGLDGDDRRRFQAWLRPRLSARLAAIESPGGSESESEGRLLRAWLTRLQVLYAEDDSQRSQLAGMAKPMVDRIAAGETAEFPDPDLQWISLMSLALRSDADTADAMIRAYENSSDPNLRRDLLRSLAVTRDEAATQASRSFAMSGRPRQDELSSYFYWSLYPLGQADGWGWIQRNFDALVERMPTKLAADMPFVFFADWLCDEAQSKTLNSLYAGRLDEFTGAERSLALAGEAISVCRVFRETHLSTARGFLDNANI